MILATLDMNSSGGSSFRLLITKGSITCRAEVMKVDVGRCMMSSSFLLAPLFLVLRTSLIKQLLASLMTAK